MKFAADPDEANPELEKGLPVPEWVFAAADGQVLEERNVRTVFTRLLEKAGHGSIQITVDTYDYLIPGANRAAVDGLDDAPAHPDATQVQPQPQKRIWSKSRSPLD